MANTYTQVYIHLIFAVKGRRNLIPETHREQLEKYMTGIISNHDSKMLAIYCNPDHCHILIGLAPKISISKIADAVKSNSSRWINKTKRPMLKFEWQSGYSAFSHSRRERDGIIKYILNQPEHHKKKTFKEEYLELLKEFEIDYNDKYLFDFYD